MWTSLFFFYAYRKRYVLRSKFVFVCHRRVYYSLSMADDAIKFTNDFAVHVYNVNKLYIFVHLCDIICFCFCFL